MKPSKEAIEAAVNTFTSRHDYVCDDKIEATIQAAYAIDLAPLELCYSLLQTEREQDGQCIKALEGLKDENENLKQRLYDMECQWHPSPESLVWFDNRVKELEAENERLKSLLTSSSKA